MKENQYPLVSVLMTAYNREKYISYSIKSVLESSFKDFELIILDDASTDKTLEIAYQFGEIDKRIRIYCNEINIGDYPNRNKIATYAKGKYIKYIDSDDLIYPWGLEIMVNMMEKYPDSGWGLCSIKADLDNIFPIELSPEKAYEYHYLGPGLFNLSPLSSIIKLELFNLVGGFQPLRMVGDFEMWHRLALQYKVLLMPQGLVWYRVHVNQEMKDYKKYEQVYENLKIKYLKKAEQILVNDKFKLIFKNERQKIKKQILVSFIKFKIKRNIFLLRILLKHYI
jgi:glycosyltransferase involved in cell wall biosynthesis